MLARAFAAEVPAEWVVGETVYGYDELRLWLEAQQKNYVLAVSETHQIWVRYYHGIWWIIQPAPANAFLAIFPLFSAMNGSPGRVDFCFFFHYTFIHAPNTVSRDAFSLHLCSHVDAWHLW
jgi:hypothetical protein